MEASLHPWEMCGRRREGSEEVAWLLGKRRDDVVSWPAGRGNALRDRRLLFARNRMVQKEDGDTTDATAWRAMHAYQFTPLTSACLLVCFRAYCCWLPPRSAGFVKSHRHSTSTSSPFFSYFVDQARKMRVAAASIGVLVVLATAVYADTYMHNPRGSNNRLNERSANRNNGNRLFDSQVR